MVFLQEVKWSEAQRARRFGPQGQCGWAEGQDLGTGWDAAGKASLISEIKPHAQCPFDQAWLVSLAGWHEGLS